MMEVWLPALLALIAFLYASVGHGGASGYLAAMTLLGFTNDVLRPTALVLNLFVSAVAFSQFARAGHFQWRLFWPFAVASVPFAWLGGRIELEPDLYNRILAICLLAAVARLFGLFGSGKEGTRTPPVVLAMAIGAALGMLSGMIGIGGGVLLSPLLLICGWSTVKESAGVSAAFIFVNSLAGIVALSDTALPITMDHVPWIVAAFAGGMLGSYIGAKHYSAKRLKQVLGAVLLFASVKLLIA
ncbi:MAG TPA: sulfite exporter TauE/SafE family protein [Flavobacteriales bacterium]|nr:sulfite exporter TauE/SafE family protein [Flavobacteriales bacterium]